MSEQDNIRMVQEIWKNTNSHNPDASDSYYSRDVRTRQPGIEGETRDVEQAKMILKGYFKAFPDLHFTLNDVIAQKDLVSVSWTGTGTHKGQLSTPNGGTIEATNRKGTVRGTTVYEIKNGKIVRQEVYWDMAELLMQLGVLEMARNR